jgi:Putative metal-binding motif/Lamin Tail Domain
MRAGLLWLFLGACTAQQKESDSDVPVDSDTGVTDGDGDGSPAGEDCNDGNPAVYPGAEEVWYDGIDQACDGGDDYDQDNDGVEGGETGPDCDDLNAEVYPGALEFCDGLDNDCTGAADDFPVDGVALYRDSDADGFGAGTASTELYCEVIPGQSAVAGDCDDRDPNTNPGAPELCDGLDNDCSGYSDDNPTDGQTWYADFDQDGYGDPTNAVTVCGEAPGYIADGTDCDDGSPGVHPTAIEVCDGVDQDCNGSIDDNAVDPSVWYQDADGDQDGDPTSSQVACTAPAGFVSSNTDCNDGEPAQNGYSTEVCNGFDDDCNGITDTDAIDAQLWHPDTDGDGYGDAATTVPDCNTIAGWTTDGSDCDDNDAAVAPGETEVCDEQDNNCDGTVDEATATDAVTWYIDADGDLFGDASMTTVACDVPVGYTDNTDDCNDAEPGANPASREVCDGLDDDCDGVIDEDDAVDAAPWYTDADADGYGDPSLYTIGCTGPSGSVDNGDDCNDANALVSPLGTETQDVSDEDCDGLVDEDFVAVGDIVVTEIARQPYTGGSGTSKNSNAQWFEVYNSSSVAIDLTGWYFEEQDGDRFFLSPEQGLLVQPGDYAVLCYADTWFATPSTCDYTWGDATLGSLYSDTTFYFDREEDLISLYLLGVLMDEVHWYNTAEVDGDLWPATARYSMQVDVNSMDIQNNDDAGSWCLAASSSVYSSSAFTGHPDYGTPGAANRACN